MPIYAGRGPEPILPVDDDGNEALDFACICGDKNEPDKVWEWAVWNMTSNRWKPRDRMHALDVMLMYLSNLGAELSFATDQWSLVSASNKDTWREGKGPGDYSTSTQCDRITDGILYTYVKWAKKFGDWKP